MDGRIIFAERSRSRIASVELHDWIVAGYDPDDNEIEEAVIVELDYSPADPDVDKPEASFNVTRVRYAGAGKLIQCVKIKSGTIENRLITVEPRLITADMRQTWEDQAAEFVAEYLEGERDAAMEAKLNARRDGD